MPDKFLKVCKYPHCSALTTETYCPKHKLAVGREYNRNRRHPDHNKFYGRQWRQIRSIYITAHPICEECLKHGRYVPADEVHHIVSPENGGTHDDSNLRSLCKSCHTKTRNS